MTTSSSAPDGSTREALEGWGKRGGGTGHGVAGPTSQGQECASHLHAWPELSLPGNPIPRKHSSQGWKPQQTGEMPSLKLWSQSRTLATHQSRIQKQPVMHLQEINFASTAYGFPDGSDGKESTCNAGDLGPIPGSRRSPGGGNVNPLQYPCLENLMDREARWAAVMGLQRVRHDWATYIFKSLTFGDGARLARKYFRHAHLLSPLCFCVSWLQSSRECGWWLTWWPCSPSGLNSQTPLEENAPGCDWSWVWTFSLCNAAAFCAEIGHLFDGKRFRWWSLFVTFPPRNWIGSKLGLYGVIHPLHHVPRKHWSYFPPSQATMGIHSCLSWWSWWGQTARQPWASLTSITEPQLPVECTWGTFEINPGWALLPGTLF